MIIEFVYIGFNNIMLKLIFFSIFILCYINAVLQSQVENIGKPVTGPMPTGCDSVKALGWTQSAFYTVKGSGGKKINTVYCDFSKKTGMTGLQKNFVLLDHLLFVRLI